MAVEESCGLTQEVREEIIPHLRLDLPAAAVERLAHAEPPDAADDRDGDEEHGAPHDGADEGTLADLVDPALEEAGCCGGERVRDQHEHQSEQVGALIAPEIGQEGTEFTHWGINL